MNKHFFRYVLNLLIGLLLAACAAPPSITPTTIISTLPPSPSSTLSPRPPTATSTHTPTPTATLTASPRPSRTPTLTPTITPTPLPLTEGGPWLLFTVCNSPGLACVGVANLDGSSLRRLVPPEIHPSWLIHIEGLPQRALLLNNVVHHSNTIDPGDLDYYQLRILSLPDMAVIQQIPLLSPAVLEAIATDLENLRQQGWEGMVPPRVDIAQQAKTLLSPDGRYLAFSSAMAGAGHDIYVYDLETNTIQRLTTGQEFAVPWAWSPDSQWVVYHIQEVPCDVTCTYAGVGAVSLTGEDKFLYEPEIYHDDALEGWKSNDTFLVHANSFEGPDSNLRQVNVRTGNVQTLYAGTFGDVAFNPNTQQILLNFGDQTFASFDEIPQGIYLLPAGSQSPTMLLPGSYWYVRWVASLGQFLAEGYDDARYGVLFTPDGQIQQTFQDYESLEASPDGQWLLVGHPSGYTLQNIQGEVAAQLGGGQIIWFNATTFYRLTRACNSDNKLYLHQQGAVGWTETLLLANLPQCSMEILFP